MVNSTDFPNIAIQKNEPYTTVTETGFTIVRFFLPPGTVTTSKTYANGTEFEVFRVSASGSGSIALEMIHRDAENPYVLTLVDETASIEWVGAVKFYGTGASGAGAIQILPLTIVVPLELTNFSAKTDKNVNKLDWETKSERDLSHFIVEKSSDKADKFVAIGEVKAQSNTDTPQYYSLIDAQPSFLDYYRLKMIDNNGEFEYSKTISLARSTVSKEKLAIFPNPTYDFMTIQVQSPHIGALFKVTDELGRQILNGQIKSAAEIIDMRSFPTGIYFLRVENIEPIKFLKQ